MEKISKIIPPSRRTQYMDLAKKRVASQEAGQTGQDEIFAKPTGRVSSMNAKRIEMLSAANEKTLPGKVTASEQSIIDRPLQDISNSPVPEKSIDFNRSADVAPGILEDLVVNKTSSPVDRVNIARAKEASEFVQGRPYGKQKESGNAVTDPKSASYESMKEAKQLQAARDIAKKFQVNNEVVQAKKEIKGPKTVSETALEKIDRNDENVVRS
ncbi:MAG: hypothetical protein ACK5P5_09180 [Pseudobdellovibrionaceae bacterium]